jgi:hypothetical protein
MENNVSVTVSRDRAEPGFMLRVCAGPGVPIWNGSLFGHHQQDNQCPAKKTGQDDDELLHQPGLHGLSVHKVPLSADHFIRIAFFFQMGYGWDDFTKRIS